MCASDLPRHRLEDVEPGTVFLRKDGSLWECIAIATDPTMTLQQLKPSALLQKRVSLVVSAPGTRADYERLIPESKVRS